MEDMARLALVEQSVKDSNKFSEILYELLRHIINILENPHDYKLRTIDSDVLKNYFKYEALGEYMKYLGYRPVADTLIYPKENTVSRLQIAQVTIERKICFCNGALDQSRTSIQPIKGQTQTKKCNLTPVDVLKTKNSLLLKIQSLFNYVLKYEDEELQELTREKIPVETLQLMAIERMREHQKRIKSGQIKGRDLSFNIALLLELLGWFKHKFFTWVDKPPCEQCGGETRFSETDELCTKAETCTVEVYYCSKCDLDTDFPRYNDLRTLLHTRRGRCGEWANCFTLVCRAMGYDTRYVYDVTDHVWCEVFDYDSNTWLHVDPSEAEMNAPLTYSHGWGKKLSYVIGVSRDDVQDVTWRYTTNHKEVLKRRNLCDEKELINAIKTLREYRQRQVSEARRKYLAKRTLQELAQLMVERTPEDYEKHGRTSGSLKWRQTRGEAGNEPHTFQLTTPGCYNIHYYAYADKYRILRDGRKINAINTWEAGVYECDRIAMKVEKDWKMAYLARDEDQHQGSISWKLSTDGEHIFKALHIRVTTAVYESGRVDWYIKFDDDKRIAVKLGESPTAFDRAFTSAVITAELSGGNGDVAWQHAQLFRTRFDSKSSGFDVQVSVDKKIS